jgi:hypothetical protein
VTSWTGSALTYSPQLPDPAGMVGLGADSALTRPPFSMIRSAASLLRAPSSCCPKEVRGVPLMLVGSRPPTATATAAVAGTPGSMPARLGAPAAPCSRAADPAEDRSALVSPPPVTPASPGDTATASAAAEELMPDRDPSENCCSRLGACCCCCCCWPIRDVGLSTPPPVAVMAAAAAAGSAVPPPPRCSSDAAVAAAAASAASTAS